MTRNTQVLRTATLALALCLGLATLAQAGWFLPITGFNNTIDRALQLERDEDHAKAKEAWAKVLKYGD